MPQTYCDNATVVLAHGPWFDACLWHSAILPLQKEGLRVTAAPLTFATFEEDIVAVKCAVAQAMGPVVVVGHSYAGAVVSAAAPMSEKAVGCVYLSALIPPPGQTIRGALACTPS